MNFISIDGIDNHFDLISSWCRWKFSTYRSQAWWMQTFLLCVRLKYAVRQWANMQCGSERIFEAVSNVKYFPFDPPTLVLPPTHSGVLTGFLGLPVQLGQNILNIMIEILNYPSKVEELCANWCSYLDQQQHRWFSTSPPTSHYQSTAAGPSPGRKLPKNLAGCVGW